MSERLSEGPGNVPILVDGAMPQVEIQALQIFVVEDVIDISREAAALAFSPKEPGKRGVLGKASVHLEEARPTDSVAAAVALNYP